MVDFLTMDVFIKSLQSIRSVGSIQLLVRKDS